MLVPRKITKWKDPVPPRLIINNSNMLTSDDLALRAPFCKKKGKNKKGSLPRDAMIP